MTTNNQTPDLTKAQKEVLHWLESRGQVYWIHTTSYETRALNALITKGLAKYDETDRSWKPVRIT